MATRKAKSAIRMEGMTLAVTNVQRSVDFYTKKLGFRVEMNSAPHFALVRVGTGPSIGLLANGHAMPKGTKPATKPQRASIHVELSTDDLDGVYKKLKVRGVKFTEPPHDEAWERSAQARDPDGYTIEFAQGRRRKNAPGR
ncbi:MAG TPA: VOC family protein [Stellaceae bacterium]|jgi:catechol 2,3-dioxygenase-like lactoylglutathione lyase family enzyme